ncbi:unnamed protein product [Spirodela intermedia]|uniref:Protein kinase domain-containing protein n=1 Tax=Spirodela intermedia TaxID=51605 RepID=A0A7I8JM52_SPIIN|nr:unnamed protein product [Spirodela intermedia]CAA6671209.1 unnamed protein product [Spirodela intermedia]
MFAGPAGPSAVAFLGVFLLLRVLVSVRGSTDGPDVSALNVMYNSLNSPSSLTGWTSSGGDPCGQRWKGIKCSGPSVTEIKLSGLGLTGSIGYQLSSLTSVTHLLKPCSNSFTGGVPYSISQMTDLTYLNLANNQLSGQLTDMFGKLPSLTFLDLSYNQLTGDLPQSFGSLSSIKTLHLQNNQFTGKIDVLAALPLENLNVQNNHFTGWVPDELKGIDNLQTQGNSWSSGPAPPRSTPRGANHRGDSSGSEDNSSKEGNGTNSGVNGAIAGIVIFVFILGLVLLVLAKRRRSSSHYIDEENLGPARPFTYLDSNNFKDLTSVEPNSSAHVKMLSTPSSFGLKPPPSDRHRSFNDTEFASKFHAKRNANPIDAPVFSLMDLQTATASFSASRIVGEGSTGHVYKAKYADGKVLAVKRIDSSHLRSGNSEDFKNLVSGICRLHHPNITELLGYCCESGHHLLVYEFQKNGSLHEFLHLSDEYSKPLTWDTRVRIALGTARANIKSANILLNAELNPHLTDCGLGVLYSPSAYTLKSDVYSFGVVMLELLTGRMPFDSSKSRSEQSLACWATPQLHDIDALAKMVDPALRGLYPPSLCQVTTSSSFLCQSEPEFRPPMSEVVQALLRCEQPRV